jgi:hypothetical protein
MGRKSFSLALLINTVGALFSFGQIPVTDVAGTTVSGTIAGLNAKIALAQASHFASVISDAVELYNTTADIYKTGVQIYNTGQAAVDLAKRVAGDVKGMMDLQSYQMMFSRMQAQELARINASAVPLINFNQAYNSVLGRYISPEGAVNVFALAKDYSQNPNVGYSKVLVQMTNMNRQTTSLACQSYETEAKALENQALLYEKEAQYVSNFLLYANMGVSMDNLMNDAGTLDRVLKTNTSTGTDGIERGSISSSFLGMSNTINSASQALVKKEMENYAKKNGKEITAQSSDQMMVRFAELQQTAITLRMEASKKRAFIWSNCGHRDFMNELGRRNYQDNLKKESSSDL